MVAKLAVDKTAEASQRARQANLEQKIRTKVNTFEIGNRVFGRAHTTSCQMPTIPNHIYYDKPSFFFSKIKKNE